MAYFQTRRTALNSPQEEKLRLPKVSILFPYGSVTRSLSPSLPPPLSSGSLSLSFSNHFPVCNLSLAHVALHHSLSPHSISHSCRSKFRSCCSLSFSPSFSRFLYPLSASYSLPRPSGLSFSPSRGFTWPSSSFYLRGRLFALAAPSVLASLIYPFNLSVSVRLAFAYPLACSFPLPFLFAASLLASRENRQTFQRFAVALYTCQASRNCETTL